VEVLLAAVVAILLVLAPMEVEPALVGDVCVAALGDHIRLETATVAVPEVVSPVLSAVVGVPSNAVPSLHYHVRFLVGAAFLGVAQHMPKVTSVEDSSVLVAVPVSVLVAPSTSAVE